MMIKTCNCNQEHKEKFVCDNCFDKAKERIEMLKEGRILFDFDLEPKEINYIVNHDYDTGSKIGNNVIGHTVVRICKEGVYLPENRKAFVAQMLKNKVVEELSNNENLGFGYREALANNYTHSAILGAIRFMIGMREFEEKTGKDIY